MAVGSSLRLVLISDTHGQHSGLDVPEGDVLVHAGDLTRQGLIRDVLEFDDFLAEMPHPHKIVVAGNHDWCFQREPHEARRALAHGIYLEDASYTIAGLTFYGSPWQPEFMDWAFNLPRGPALAEKWAQIPAKTDVLITHGPPRGIGDLTFDGRHEGCDDLRRRVATVAPRYHLFGHIHEARGQWRVEGTTFVNGANSGMRYPPVVLEL